ncbi:MAG: hypothetical protein NTW52_05250 [Planctomycetota bacterium]|nr:hypothetical protein [Planctomycetota bacterium]
MKRFGWFALGCVAVGGLVWGINTSIAQLPERDGPGQQGPQSGPQSGPRREGLDDRRPGRPPQEGGRGGEGFAGDPERRGPGGPGGPGPGPGGPRGLGPGGPMGGPGPGMSDPPPTRFLRVLDLNRDFQISADEIAKASESLKRLDIDQDGIITEEEFNMPPPRPPRHGMEGGPPSDGYRGERPQGDGPEGRRPPPPREDAGSDEPRSGPPRSGPPRGEPGRDGRRGGPEGRPQPEGPPPGAAVEQPKDAVAIAPSELPKDLPK